MVSERASNISESLTLAIDNKAKWMIKQGQDVVMFGSGQPDFPTPDNIKKAAVKAINDNFSGYTAVSGIIGLKKAIIDKFKRDNKIDYKEEEIIVGCGGKHVLYNIMQVLVNKGDEVIIPMPYWLSNEEQVKLAEGEVVFARTDNFKIKAELIEEKISDKTKMIILNSPCNPSGAVIEKDELKKIADLAVSNKIWVVSDEAYEKFIYDGKEHVSIASFGDEIKKLSFTVNAVSKTYAMTGWRIGYCGGNKEIVKAMNDLQSHSTSNPCSIAQMAALEALKGSQHRVNEMVKEFDKRRKFMFKKLDEVGLRCIKPEGTFYCLPEISLSGLGSMDFASRLLEKAKVAVVPGKVFGANNNIRLSYACSMEEIIKGMDRIKRFLKENL